jgi:hypothetical protein
MGMQTREIYLLVNSVMDLFLIFFDINFAICIFLNSRHYYPIISLNGQNLETSEHKDQIQF